MEPRALWWLVFAQVLSLRLHPRNDRDGIPDIGNAVFYARKAADAAMEIYYAGVDHSGS